MRRILCGPLGDLRVSVARFFSRNSTTETQSGEAATNALSSVGAECL